MNYHSAAVSPSERPSALGPGLQGWWNGVSGEGRVMCQRALPLRLGQSAASPAAEGRVLPRADGKSIPQRPLKARSVALTARGLGQVTACHFTSLQSPERPASVTRGL
ncbi:unnamed protein product [Gadus morhua 'NCC']